MSAAAGLSTGGTVFFSSLCVSTFGLGSWQAKRYFEKIEQVHQREKELAQDPLELEKDAKCSLLESMAIGDNRNGNGVGNANTDIEIARGHRPFSLTGKFRHENEILVGPRGPPLGALGQTGPNSGRSQGGMASSPQGFYCLTPFERANNMGTVIVNRGWIPRSFVQQNASWQRPNGILTLVAVPSKTEQPRFISPPHDVREPKQLLWYDRSAIEQKSKTSGTAPLILTETTVIQASDGDLPPFKPSKESVGEFKVTPTTHAGYAITWFGLSGAGIIMTRKLITGGRR